MIQRLATPAVFLLLASGPAIAGPGTCMAGASDAASGQTVVLRFKVDNTGAIASREAEWDLAAPGQSGLTGISLKVRYSPPSSDILGPVTSVSVYHLGVRSQATPAGATAWLETGAGKRWSAPLQSMFGTGIAQLSLKTPWSPPRNPQLAETIESTEAITVSLRDQKKKPLESLALTPSDHAVRDRLFAEASTKVQKLAEAPAACQ